MVRDHDYSLQMVRNHDYSLELVRDRFMTIPWRWSVIALRLYLGDGP